MKRLLFKFRLLVFLLLVGHADVGGAPLSRIDAVDPRVSVKSSLAVAANIYFGDQDEETHPVETEFYLLDKSLIEILKTARFEPELPNGEKRLPTDAEYLEAAAQALTAGDDDAEAALVAFLINEELLKHRRAVAATDLLGRGSFRAVKTGDYFLFGIGRTQAEIFVWHLPVQIKAGGNRVELDQTNAGVIFSSE